MFGNDERDKALSLVEAQLSYWQSQVESQRATIEKAEEELAAAISKLSIAQGFLQLIRERYGLPGAAEPRPHFEGLALREAALEVIKERRSITAQQLIAELQAGGFQFDDHPRRQLHAALIHQKQAFKDAAGTWRWVAPAQGALPLETKGKEVSGEK